MMYLIQECPFTCLGSIIVLSISFFSGEVFLYLWQVFVIVVKESSLAGPWSRCWTAMLLDPAINLSLILGHLTRVQGAYGRLSVQLVAESLV